MDPLKGAYKSNQSAYISEMEFCLTVLVWTVTQVENVL